MKTPLTLAIVSSSISVISWLLIIGTNLAGATESSIAFGLAWFFLGIPPILVLSIVALIKAFKKPNSVQVPTPPLQYEKAAKIMSVISLVLLIVPFLYGTVGTTLFN